MKILIWEKKNESRINAVEMRSLPNVCGVCLKDRCRDNDVRKQCGLKEDVATKIEKGMLQWFGYMQKMNERRPPKLTYRANVVVEGRQESP
ncbi:hypothetical protein EVAR_26063_1 [Eumeta japonica]|uniref:Uncharacterized protein n=1 Tax=Eumeta variegata TaxID=151549 RepID=A0A4C1VRG2_EUMVA|nr:hypothetical protein EVAR_26063_1 [Eumeta japonica]